MGFTELLTIVFVVLKLIGTIDWSWWLVLLPEIIAAVFYLIVIVASLSISVGTHRRVNRLFDKHFDRCDKF